MNLTSFTLVYEKYTFNAHKVSKHNVQVSECVRACLPVHSLRSQMISLKSMHNGHHIHKQGLLTKTRQAFIWPPDIPVGGNMFTRNSFFLLFFAV